MLRRSLGRLETCDRSNAHRSSVDLVGVPEMDAMARADIVGAGGDEPVVHAVMAEVAFLSDLLGGVEGDGIIRTGLDTGPASGASVCIQDDDAVRSFGNRFHGASLGAGRIVAMSAHADAKEKSSFPSTRFGPSSRTRDELDPVGGLVLLLAGDLTGLAAPADFVLVVSHSENSCSS